MRMQGITYRRGHPMKLNNSDSNSGVGYDRSDLAVPGLQGANLIPIRYGLTPGRLKTFGPKAKDQAFALTFNGHDRRLPFGRHLTDKAPARK